MRDRLGAPIRLAKASWWDVDDRAMESVQPETRGGGPSLFRATGPLPWPSPELDRERYGQLVVGLLTLTIVGLSLTLAIGQATIGGGLLDSFIATNTLLPIGRLRLVVAAASTIGGVWLVSSVYLSFTGWRGVSRLSRFAAFLSPLATSAALPSLLAYRLWFDHPLTHLTWLLVVVLVLERLARRSIAASPGQWGFDALLRRLPSGLRAAAPLSIVVILSAAYAAYAGYLTVLDHHRFQTGGYDLGIYDSLMANLLRGKPFRSPVCTPDLSYLSNHAEFGIFYLVPFYALFPRAETLLVIQACFLGFAAVPLYLFGSTQLPKASAVFVAVAYLLYAPMHGANFYDFHWMPMAIPVWFTLFYGLARRKLSIVIPAVCFVLPIREETGVMLATLGACLILSNYWPRMGAVFSVLGVAWFGVMKFVVIPLSGTWWFESMFASLVAPGEAGYGSVIKTMVINPTYLWLTLATELKLTYVLHLFAPLAFLPLRRPLLALLACPGFFFTLLTTDYAPTISIHFQYTSHWIPWIFASAVLWLMLAGRERNGATRRRAALLALVFGVLVHSYVYGAVLQHETFVGGFEKVVVAMTPSEIQRYRAFRAVVALIPKQASVAASETVVAHVSNRPDAYTLKITHGHAEYLLINSRSFGGDEKTHVEQALDIFEYGLVTKNDGFYLFERDHNAPGTEAALGELGIRGHK